ncbi:MAG: response regulator, partial [Alphaproteobacteria bacterium]|nr:response regulator [Alphaproteobacteria bacterium]
MKVGQKVLLVEDDEVLSQSLSEQLELHEKFAMFAVENGAEALQAIKTEHFDLIILDVGLPDMDGIDVCRQMRWSGIESPIMLTGADSEADTILGLDSGANDYVTKPFQFGVLLARI